MRSIKLSGPAVEWTAENVKNVAWVARCSTLGLTAQAETWKELCDAIADSLNEMFAEAAPTNEFNELLEKLSLRTAEKEDLLDLMMGSKYDVHFTITMKR